MSKMPFMQYYPDAWLRDTRRLTRDARSTWADIVAYAWNEPERGVYERTMEAFCLEHNFSRPDAERVITELQGVADVRFSNTEVRIICRRMVREERARELNAKYQSVYREKHDSKAIIRKVSGESKRKKLEVRSQKLETSKTETPPVVPQEIIPEQQAAAIEKQYMVPLPEDRPADSLVMLYKILQGVPYNYRAWDKKWGRWKVKTQELLVIFQGVYSAAYACLKETGEKMTELGRTWTLDTVVERAHLWKQQHGGEEFAHINRDRFLRDLIDQRKQKRIEGLRRISQEGSLERPDLRNDGLCDPSGDPAALSGATAEGRGFGNNGHGRSVGSFSPDTVESPSDREGEANGVDESAWGGNGDSPGESG